VVPPWMQKNLRPSVRLQDELCVLVVRVSVTGKN